MKKEILLATIAFAFAISGAFASMFAQETIYVYGKRTAGGAAQCIQMNQTCENQPTSTICQVVVNVQAPGVGTRVPTTTGTFKTFKSGCVNVLFDYSNSGIRIAAAADGAQIYDLVVPEE